MSQLVACTSPRGLVLASDRRIAVGAGPAHGVHALRKLHRLGPWAAAATSGAAIGVAVSRFLSRLFEKRPAFPFPELEAYALSVFQKEYDDFVRQGETWFAAHPEAHRRSYVLLGGRQPDGTFSFRFYGSEAHGLPYRVLPTRAVLTAPRRLGLEGRLSRAAASGVPLEDLRDLVLSGLRRVAASDEAVAGPFDLALLDANGVRVEEAPE